MGFVVYWSLVQFRDRHQTRKIRLDAWKPYVGAVAGGRPLHRDVDPGTHCGYVPMLSLFHDNPGARLDSGCLALLSPLKQLQETLKEGPNRWNASTKSTIA